MFGSLPRLQPVAAADRPLIPTWVRVLVILLVIPAWIAMMLISLLVLKNLPGPEWTILPSAVIAAVAPGWRLHRAGDPAAGAPTATAADPAAEAPGGTP